jgi:peptidoglycan/LPS O-acetylase OafA/YrhL
MYVYHLAIFLIVRVSLSRYDATRQLSVPWALAVSLACLALTYGVARFSFHFFEQRFLMQKKRFQAKPAVVEEVATTSSVQVAMTNAEVETEVEALLGAEE